MANRDDKFSNSTEQQYSRYVQGGLTDRYNNRLGWWERREIEQRNNDAVAIVQPWEAGRPDLIAYRSFGKARFAWVILQYNNIVDINTEIVPGAELRIPNDLRLFADIMTRSTGGNPV